MVEDLSIAWHAGKSKWKNFINLNKYSLGIELVNKGHQFGYQNFSKEQINSLISLCKKLKKKYKIRNTNILGHSDIAPLRKKDPGEKFPWQKLSTHNLGSWFIERRINVTINTKKMKILFFKNLRKLGYRYFDVYKRNLNDKKIIKSFQRHYLPKGVTGKLDQKTFKISQLLASQLFTS